MIKFLKFLQFVLCISFYFILHCLVGLYLFLMIFFFFILFCFLLLFFFFVNILNFYIDIFFVYFCILQGDCLTQKPHSLRNLPAAIYEFLLVLNIAVYIFPFFVFATK